MVKKQIYADGYSSGNNPPTLLAGQYLRRNIYNTGVEFSNPLVKKELQIVSIVGQTTFTLEKTPLDSLAVQMYINGLKQDYTSEYTVSGSVATYAGPLTLNFDDRIQFEYIYDDSQDWTPLRIDNCMVYYEADDPGAVVDSSVEPRLFTSISNRGQLGGSFSAAGAARPLVANVESLNSSKRVSAFNAAGANRHESTLPAASFSWCHQEASFFIAFVPHTVAAGTRVLFTNRSSGLANPSILIGQSDTRCFVSIRNDSGAIYSLLDFTLELGQPALFFIRFKPGASPEIEAEATCGATSRYTTGTFSGAVSTNPSVVGTIGAPSGGAGGGINGFVGDICVCAGYNRYITTAEKVLLQNWAAQKYCRPSTITRQSPTVWISPSLQNTINIDTANTAASGEQVDRVWDTSGKAHDAYQATDAKEPTINRTGLGNKLSMNFDGSDDSLSVSAGVGWSANTSHTFVGVFEPFNISTVATVGYAFRAQTGALGINFGAGGFSSSVVERISINDGSVRNLGRAVTGTRLFDWNTSTTHSLYSSGVLLGTSAGTARAVSGNVGLGSNDSGSQNAQINIGDFIHRDTQITGPSLWEVRESLVTKYGFTWNSALIPDHVSIIDPRVSDSVTTAGGAVSRVNSQHANLDVIGDGLCEAAGVTAWTALRATLTKETGTPFSGSQCLRVTEVTPNPYAGQTILTVSNIYRVKAQARSDGTSIPNIVVNGIAQWTGVAGAGWQAADVTFAAAATTIYFGATLGVAGYVEWDAIQVIDVTAGAAIQGTGANQPAHTVGAAGYFQTDGGDYLASNYTFGTTTSMLVWAKLADLATTQYVFGGRTDSTHTFYTRVKNTGVWEGFLGSSGAIGSVTATTDWTPLALMAGGAPGPGHVMIGGNVFYLPTIATNTTGVVPYLFGFNDGGVLGGSGSSNGTRVGPVHIWNRVLSIRELMRIAVQEGASYGWSLPAAMTASDWNSQLDASTDSSVTELGGAVSTWADKLARVGQGATSPGASTTYPQHSVADNSVLFDGVDDGQLWVIPPNLNAGTIECWFYLRTLPGTNKFLWGALDNVVRYLYCLVFSTGVVRFIAGQAANFIDATNVIGAGWHHIVCSWTNGGAITIVLDGITTTSATGGEVAPNTTLAIGCRNTAGPGLNNYLECRIAKISIKNSAISTSQAMANYLADYETIVYRSGV